MANEGGFWVGLPLDEHGTHITIVVRSGAPESDAYYLKEILETEIRAMLPIFIQIGPDVIMKGKNLDVPTHDVEFLAPNNVLAKLNDIYDRTYMVPNDKPKFPFSPHISVKTPESKATVERILKYNGRMAILGRVELNSWNAESNKEPTHVVQV